MPFVIIDNGSSYTGDLAVLLDGLGVSYSRILSSEFSLESLPIYDGIILSGRKRNDALVNKVNSKIVRYAVKNNVKLLGICYGAEIIALTLGGTIRRSDAPQKNVRTTVEIHKSIPIVDRGFATVFESHGYEISKMPDVLEVVGSSAQCRYEIIKHRSKHMYGTQFHPEMSRDGHGMVKRFCQL